MCLVTGTYPDDSSELVHHTPVVKDEVGFCSVSCQVYGGHLHLSLFEYDLDHGVCQVTVLLLMQTTMEETVKSTIPL